MRQIHYHNKTKKTKWFLHKVQLHYSFSVSPLHCYTEISACTTVFKFVCFSWSIKRIEQVRLAYIFGLRVIMRTKIHAHSCLNLPSITHSMTNCNLSFPLKMIQYFWMVLILQLNCAYALYTNYLISVLHSLLFQMRELHYYHETIRKTMTMKQVVHKVQIYFILVQFPFLS